VCVTLVRRPWARARWTRRAESRVALGGRRSPARSLPCSRARYHAVHVAPAAFGPVRRFFFVTCRVHALRRALNESEFACLAEVIAEQGSEEFVRFQTLRPVGSALTKGRYGSTAPQTSQPRFAADWSSDWSYDMLTV
jgi:hypothetical protein